MNQLVRPRAACRGPVVRAPLVLLLTLLLVAGLLSGCSHDSGSALGDQASSERLAAQRLFNQRARAIRDGKVRLFLRSVDRTDPALVARQRRYFDNLQQLPLETFSYQVEDRAWSPVLASPAWGKGVSMPRVRVSMQLAGFDQHVVRRETGFALARRDGRLTIISDRTRGGTFFPDAEPPPWEMTRIRVRRTPDVLGVYDAGSWPDSATVNAAVEDGIGELQSVLPFSWSGRVVVYEFTNKRVLASFKGVPGGNITHLGAMTFPVPVSPGQTGTAGSRFVLMPGSVAAGEPFLGRITRHELTHVAVGAQDDGVPTWLAEGVAEYVGARDVPKSQRRIATVAVGRAAAGVDGLPASSTFNGLDQEWNYALSWMACDYVAATQGESRLWELMDALHDRGRGTTDAAQDAVLLRVLGIDSHQLARRAAHRILSIYG